MENKSRLEKSLCNYEEFFNKEVLQFATKNLEEVWIKSAGDRIHLDVYTYSNTSPTIVFSHGIAGFGRLLTPYAYKLFNGGFNVILPDLKGYGHNKEKKGHWAFSDLVSNIIDSYNYAKSKFNDEVYIAGASMGGVLAYNAACKIKDLKAVACYCLFDFSDDEFIRHSSNYGVLTKLIKSLLKVSANVIPKLSMPTSSISSFDNLSNNQKFNKTVKKDPLAGNVITLKAAKELLSASLPIPFDQFEEVPILIIQPTDDEMTPAIFSKKAYDQIKTRDKKFVSVEGRGHWVIDNQGVNIICNSIMEWFKSH